MKVVVSHPHGNPNTLQTALAFSERNLLSAAKVGLTSDSVPAKALRLVYPEVGRLLARRNYEAIPAGGVQSHSLWEVMALLGRRLKPSGLSSEISWYDLLFGGHDLQVSRGLSKNVSAVYAYEDGAKRTFQAAKKLDVATVYELPAGYYLAAANELGRAKRELPNVPINFREEPPWKRANKERELDLADVVVVASKWSEESLRHSTPGTRKTIVRVPYGTSADEVAARVRPPRGPFTVMFAGSISVRKGVPYLLKAWSKLNLEDAQLLLAGTMNLGDEFLKNYAGRYEHLGLLPRAQLLEILREVDLFVFPSLADGFGLVITEAMAAGVPVLTTKNTGGPELITDDLEGWTVPAHDVDSLIERIEWGYHNRQKLYEMGRNARRRAEKWTWQNYRQELIERLSPHLPL